MGSIVLGQVYKDSITGFEGVAIARTDWIYGCQRVTLQPQKLKEDGGVQKSEVFDVGQLVGVDPNDLPPAGPRANPARNPDAVR